MGTPEFAVPVLEEINKYFEVVLVVTQPPPMPFAIAMAFELATYGLITGLLYARLPKRKINLYVSLIVAMLVGRLVWGIASYIIYGIQGTAFTFEMFMAGAFANAIIGIVLQLIIIPPILMALQKGGYITNTN